MMHSLYSCFMFLIMPWLFFRLWWKGRKLPAYKERISERFSLNRPKICEKVDLWVHAVSLGEVIAATPLIQELLKNHKILVTTMTPTGREQVKAVFGDRVLHQYIPYDLPFALKAFFKHYRPSVGLIMETEIWPNMIYQAHKANIPLFLANARLSEGSFKHYKLLKMLFKPLLNRFQAILAQSIDDAKRFEALGAKSENVRVVGNIKFDLHLKLQNTQQVMDLKNRFGLERPVFIAASTHDNEEALLLAEAKRLQQAIPNIIILIAPRHPERFGVVFQQALAAGFKTGLRSQPESIHKDTELVVLDCLGELLNFYQISDYAFVGGSLIPGVGGHNVLEPIAVKVPVFSGNQVHNFKGICQELKKKQGIVLVDNVSDLVAAVIKGYQNPDVLHAMVHNASLVFEANKGALLRHLEVIWPYIPG